MSAESEIVRRLRESESRAALFESIMESMGESVLVVDRDGKEVFGNRELRRFRGEVSDGGDLNAWRQPAVMTISDATGRPLPPEDWPVARALRNDYATNFEIRVVGMAHVPPGQEVVLAISTRSLKDSAGNIEGAVIVTRDITSVRQTEDKLRQSQKLETIGQLTGGIAHDFNNVLAAVLNAAEVVRRGVAGNARLEHAASMIEKAALRGADLTKHLLAFARKQSLNPVATDVTALVDEALLLLRPALGATIDVKVDSTGALYALADPGLLTSALLNLCINARDAMGDRGGALTISLGEAGGMVEITVADTGSGMSPETLSRAVEPFFTTKDIGKGSGLGLSMVFGFAKQSGGDLRIESELGKGTRITILLPVAVAPSSGSAPPEPHPLAPRPIRVLVVDDDELVRDALCMQLTDAGFTTIQAQDGPAALALIDAGIEFDLLFTDMVMPRGMSGVTLAEHVRTRKPDVRVIISTGYVEKELPEGGPNWQLLRKPYTSGALFTVLQNVMLDRR